MDSSLLMSEDYYRKISPYLNQYYHYINQKTFLETLRDIQHNLKNSGISFEGKDLPISIQPTLLTKNELEGAEEAGKAIRYLLNNLITTFITEHRTGVRNSFLHKAFSPYSKWWDLIANENRLLPHIQLMRYDAIREPDGAIKFMETNTACPGGVIHCALIKQAWKMTKFGFDTMKGIKMMDFPIDDSSRFVLFLIECAQKVSSKKEVNIAICNFKGTYTNELQTIQREHQLLVNSGIISSGKLIIADIRDIDFKDDQAFIENIPIDLIYNKLNPLMIDPGEESISGWIKASECSKTDFLNGLGAMFLTEAKRVLGLLSTPMHRLRLGIHPDEIKTLDGYIPYTRILSNFDDSEIIDPNLYNFIVNQKNQFVLKADALTRGEGVYIGSQCSMDEWKNALDEIVKQNGVIQLCCKTPYRESFNLDNDGKLRPISEYYGIDLFFFGDKFAGPVSRSHQNMVFNVGNGGKESPMITIY